MRRTLIGLVAAGALLVAGCGGDDGETSTGDGDGDGDGGENASVSDFCAQFQGYDEQFNQNPDASEEEVVEAIRSLNPPEEIADDYETLLQGLDALVGVDATDPEAAEAEEEMAEYSQASENIQAYVDENCEGGASDDTSTDGSSTDGSSTDGSSTDGTEVTTGESVPTTGG